MNNNHRSMCFEMLSLGRIKDANANMAHWPKLIMAHWQDPKQLPSIPTPNAGSSHTSQWYVCKGKERNKAGPLVRICCRLPMWCGKNEKRFFEQAERATQDLTRMTQIATKCYPFTSFSHTGHLGCKLCAIYLPHTKIHEHSFNTVFLTFWWFLWIQACLF